MAVIVKVQLTKAKLVMIKANVSAIEIKDTLVISVINVPQVFTLKQKI